VIIHGSFPLINRNMLYFFYVSILLVLAFILFFTTSSKNCWIAISSKAAIVVTWKPGYIATNFYPHNPQKCGGPRCTMLSWRYVSRLTWEEQSPADETSAEGSSERGRFSDSSGHGLWLPSLIRACSATRCSSDSSESGQGTTVQGNDRFIGSTQLTQFVWRLNKE
jgi:hypothetical protein